MGDVERRSATPAVLFRPWVAIPVVPAEQADPAAGVGAALALRSSVAGNGEQSSKGAERADGVTAWKFVFLYARDRLRSGPHVGETAHALSEHTAHACLGVAHSQRGHKMLTRCRHVSEKQSVEFGRRIHTNGQEPSLAEGSFRASHQAMVAPSATRS